MIQREREDKTRKQTETSEAKKNTEMKTDSTRCLKASGRRERKADKNHCISRDKTAKIQIDRKAMKNKAQQQQVKKNRSEGREEEKEGPSTYQICPHRD